MLICHSSDRESPPWAVRKVPVKDSESGEHSNLSRDQEEVKRMRRELQRNQPIRFFHPCKTHCRSNQKSIEGHFFAIHIYNEDIRSIRGKKGGISMPESQEYSFKLKKKDNNRDCIVFFPTNGVGDSAILPDYLLSPNL